MVETLINVTESFQIYQKLKKKNNKSIRSEHEQFIFVYKVYKIYAAKKMNMFTHGKSFYVTGG